MTSMSLFHVLGQRDCKHVWPLQRSKQPLSWQSAPGPQGAAGSVCPSRGQPGVVGTQRCQGRTQTRGGPVGGRLFLVQLGGEITLEFRYSNDLIWFNLVVKYTFTVSDLLFNVVHFQVFWSRSSPSRNISFLINPPKCIIKVLLQLQWCLMPVPFRPRSILALLASSTYGLRMAVAPCLLSFFRSWFPSNTDNPFSGADTEGRVACKILIRVLLGLLDTFKAKSWCVYGPSASLFATYLFWEWSASGVDDVCVVVFEFWSGRRPRGCRPWSVRGRSVPRRSGNKPSLLRFISEYGQLTCLQTRQKKSQFRDTNTFTLSAHTNKVRFILWRICTFLYLWSQKAAILEKKKDGGTSLTCNESRSEVP